MTTNYVLIDFENVQPANLEILKQHPFKVLLFVGAHQGKVPFDLAYAMQGMGEAAQYIRISGSGKNSLDFHIAYYIGELAAQDPKACFYVISRDTGFDPLLKHLEGRQIRVQRKKDLAEIPELSMSVATTDEAKVSAIVQNLVGRGQARPRKVQTLSNTINSLFTDKLSNKALASLIDQLEVKKYIKINDGNVSYDLSRRH